MLSYSIFDLCTSGVHLQSVQVQVQVGPYKYLLTLLRPKGRTT